ncbi:MAG: lipid A-modifier LpxR family protein [Ekhidna sp.]
MRILVFLILFFATHFSDAQSKSLNRELMVEADNDAYTLNLTRDQYYSNGVYLRYRHLTDSSKLKNGVDKIVRTYHMNHRIFSPRHLWWTELEDLDRPYAGQFSISISNEYYLKNESYFKAQLELGWMGPAVGADRLQYGWHETFGMQLPQAWQYQINDAPIVNLYGTYVRTLVTNATKDAEIITESNIALGTTFTHARQELMFRVGKFNPIQSSSQLNGVIGRKNDGKKLQEFYFFISPGVEYIAHNSTIEGNIVGKESIYTEVREPWVYQTRAGLLWGWTRYDLAFILYRRTKETPESTFHKYVGIRMNLRF